MDFFNLFLFSSVQSLSRVWLFATPWIAAHQTSLSITNSCSLFKLTSIESVMPSSHLILCHPLLLLPQIPPSIRVFSNESTLPMRWPKYWSFSFSISPFNEHPGLISFRMDWLDLLAIQGTLKSLLQHFTILWWFLPYINMNQPWIYMCSPSWNPLPPPSPSHPSGSSQCTSPEHLSHASHLDWQSISHLITYMFQYYSFRSSHTHLPKTEPGRNRRS